MEHDFWHSKWQENEIGFHEADGNHFLKKYIDSFNLEKGSRVFVPLCGKTLDIKWLIKQGFEVVGVELVEKAVIDLFEILKIQPEVQTFGKLKHYRADNLDIYCGDLFELTKQEVRKVDLIYDRAAVVALPQDMRNRYAIQLVSLTNNASQLLVSFSYDQSLMQGPPFSVDKSEVERLYKSDYKIELMDSMPVKFRGKMDATELIFKLK